MILVLSALASSALALEPGDAALGFFRRLQENVIPVSELLGETILSPQTGTIRRVTITKRLDRVGRYLRGNQYEFEILDEKQDGEFAAVILSAISRYDPLEVDVLALGMRRDQDDSWAVAPVPGSFDNVYLGYDEELERRIDALEVWMGSARVSKLRDLHRSVLQEFRERMNKAVPRALLEESNPAKLVSEFVAACGERNLAAATVLLGQFEGEVLEEDRALLRVLSRGLHGLDHRKHWRLLTSPDVVRLVVQDDPGDDVDAEVSLLIFDPSERGRVNLVHFVLLRSGKRWIIELPSSLRLADQDRITFERALLRGRNEDDDELRNQFQNYFEERNETRRAQSLQEAGTQIEKVLREGTLAEFFRFVHRSEKLSESERRRAYRYLGEFWSKIHQDSRATSECKLVEVIEHEDAGVLVFHLISTANFEHLKLVSLVLMKDESGWAIVPGVTTAANFEELPKEQRAHQDEVVAMFNGQKKELSKKASAELMKRFVIAIPAEGVVVSRKEASELVKEFRGLLGEGRLLACFEYCALLDLEEGAWEALKALSSEYKGALQAKAPDREVHVNGDTPWAAVTLRVDSGKGRKPYYPMYLVIATKEGPRIVVDVGLRLATNKGRVEINRRVWKRIDEQLEEKESALVRSLFEGHVEHSKIDLAEWEKSNKSSP
jgi:hypothetical protein